MVFLTWTTCAVHAPLELGASPGWMFLPLVAAAMGVVRASLGHLLLSVDTLAFRDVAPVPSSSFPLPKALKALIGRKSR